MHPLKRFTVMISAGFIMLSPTVSNARNAAEDTGHFAHEASDLEPDKKILFGVLENGLRYVVMHNDTPENVAALRMVIDTGSLNETDAQRGLAHFLEHMAFNGSKNVPEGEMIKRLERLGLSFGADTNASTGYEQTTYKLNLPSVDAAVLDEAFFLMRETAQNLLLDDDAIERERGVIASEKRTRDTVGFRAYMALQDFLSAGSTRTERSPIGIDETIASMPKSEFEAYYRGYYRPENTTIVFVGDFDPDEAIQRITDTFADWEPDGPALDDRALIPARLSPGVTGLHFDSSIQTSLTMAALRPYSDEPDSSAIRRERIVEAIGRDILNRRLILEIERGGPAFLSASASSYRRKDTVDGALLTVRFAPDNWRAAMAEADLELRRALQFGFSQAELDESLAANRRAYQTQADGADSRSTYASRGSGLIDGLTRRLAGERVLTSPDADLKLFETIATTVSLAEVEAAFRSDWATYEDPQIFLSGNVRLDDYDALLRSALADARLQTPDAPVARMAGDFPFTEFGEPGKVLTEDYVADIDTYLFTFENGVRVTFKQTEFEGERIRVTIRAGGGFMSMPRPSEGLRRLGLNLLTKGGVDGFYDDELRRIFAGKSVSSRFRTRIDDDAFSLEGATNPSDFADYLNLATAKIVAPVFRETTAKRHFDLMRAWYPLHDGTIYGVVGKELPRLVRSGDKRYGFDSLDDFLSPTIDEVAAWIAPQLAHSPIEILIIGDVERGVAVAEIARTLGALKPRTSDVGEMMAANTVRFPDGQAEPYVFHHRDNPDQALVRVYWPAPGADNPHDGFRMQVLRSLFRNRLSDVLREELGATYSPGVGTFANPLYPAYGYLMAHVITSPSQVEQVHKSILEVATKMADEPIAEDDFQRALLPLVEDISSSLENNGYWMNVLSDARDEGYQLRAFREREASYAQMSASDIAQLAAQVLSNERAITAFILPKISSGK